MATVQTKDLSGPALNWAAAKAEGHADLVFHPSTGSVTRAMPNGMVLVFSYADSWMHAGPLIERERIDVISDPNGTAGWMGRNYLQGHEVRFFGPTPLVAAMRCYVACKLGQQVEVPDELMKGE
jgi:hypothetical protein